MTGSRTPPGQDLPSAPEEKFASKAPTAVGGDRLPVRAADRDEPVEPVLVRSHTSTHLQKRGRLMHSPTIAPISAPAPLFDGYCNE